MANFLMQWIGYGSPSSPTRVSLDYSEKDFDAWHQGIRATLTKFARYPSIHDMHCRQDIDQLKIRLAKAKNPFMKDKRGDTPLHHMMRHEFRSSDVQCHAVTLLVNAGHPLDEGTKGGLTALQLAEEKNLSDVVATLLDLGAKVGPSKQELLAMDALD
jgi:ankyrin repeat protein